MTHVSPIRLGLYAPRPRAVRRWWSWRMIAAADAASGVGMLALGVVARGPAGVVVLMFAALVLVESGGLIARDHQRRRRL